MITIPKYAKQTKKSETLIRELIKFFGILPSGSLGHYKGYDSNTLDTMFQKMEQIDIHNKL